MKFLKHLFRSPLFKISALNSVSVVIKIGIGLIISKVIAIFVGPIGMALVGNLRNFTTLLETISTLGFQNGVVKYVAEHKSDSDGLNKLLSTIGISLLVVVIFLSSALLYFSEELSLTVLGTSDNYSQVFKLFAFALPWYACSSVLIAIVNGLSKFKEVIYITIWGNMIGLLVSVGLIWNYQTLGALLATIITPSLVFFVALYYVHKEIKLFDHISIKSFSGAMVSKLSSYSIMALVASIVGATGGLIIRNNIIHHLGMTQAGYWEAMNRISTQYLMFVSTILSIYFLPKLVEAKTPMQTQKVFLSYYKTILPVFIVVMLSVFVLKGWVIRLLFTPAFLPVENLFFWQLIGDIFKVGSLILGFAMIAQNKTKAFVITEVLSISIMLATSYFFISLWGIQGVVIAHCCTYLFYWLILMWYFREEFKNPNNKINIGTTNYKDE